MNARDRGTQAVKAGAQPQCRGLGGPLASVFCCTGCPKLTGGRQMSPVGPQARGWRAGLLRALPGRAAIHEIDVSGAAARQLRGASRGGTACSRWQAGGALQPEGPGRRLEPTWLLGHSQSELPDHSSLSLYLLLPKGPWSDHRESPKVRTAARFSG